ncbi:MAG: tetratricopeptide repeat protein [Bacteroidetes bacterium]|nr:tetratricopeptide repeat protein [Bacteroidota bacterium]
MRRNLFSWVVLFRWYATGALLLGFQVGHGQHATLERLKTMEGEELREAVGMAYDSAIKIKDYSLKQQYFDALFDLTAEKDEIAHSQALVYRALLGDKKQTQLFDQAFELAKKNNHTDAMCFVEYNRGLYYIANKQYDTAMIHILRYRDMTPPSDRGGGYRNVMNLLGDIYYQAGLYSRAEQVYMDLLKLHQEEGFYNHYRPYVMMNNIGQMRLKTGNPEEAAQWFRQSLTMANTHLRTPYRMNTLAYTQIKLAECALANDNLTLADSLLVQSQRYPIDSIYEDVQQEYVFTKAQLLTKQGLYTEAVHNLWQLLPGDSVRFSNLRFVPESYKLLAVIYQQLKDCALANVYSEKYNHLSDSLRELEHVAQSMIILADRDHELTRQELQKARNKVYALVLGLTVLIILLAVVGLLYHKLYKSKIELVKKTLASENQPDIIPSIIEDTEEMSDEELEQENELIARLKAYMETEKPYLDPQLSLQDVAKHLSTNRTYLSRAINNHHFTTFPNYLNVYRIRESIRLITTGFTMNHTQEALAKECGFANRTSFGIVFKKLVGVAPSFFSAHYNNKQELKI